MQQWMEVVGLPEAKELGNIINGKPLGLVKLSVSKVLLNAMISKPSELEKLLGWCICQSQTDWVRFQWAIYQDW